MANDDKQSVSVLNDLIETCKDGEQGFRTAAEKVKESSLNSLFLKYAAQRAEYAQQLQSLVSSLGGDPASSGHVAGTLHRGWINLKEALSKNEDKAIIDECEAGEDAALKNYREAVNKSLPVKVAAIVQQQLSGVEQSHRVLSDLKHGRAKASGA